MVRGPMGRYRREPTAQAVSFTSQRMPRERAGLQVVARGGTSYESPGINGGIVTSGAVTRGSLDEAFARIVEPVPANAAQPHRPERAPVDRDGRSRTQQPECGRGGRRIHMTTPQGRPPAADRQDRQVQARGEVGHPREDVGVAGEVDAILPSST